MSHLMATSPVVDLVTDPGGVVEAVVSTLARWALVHGPVVAPAVLALTVVFGVIRHGLRGRALRRRSVNARLITVLIPPEVDPAGGQVLWHNLVGLLRPRIQRFLHGQPHLTFEYAFGHEGTHIRIWVPGSVPPGMVERAVESAWPGAHTRAEPTTTPMPITTERDPRVVCAGGELRLGRPEALPIQTEHTADPLRALLGAPRNLAPGQHACVQVLARPVTGGRLRQARRAARHLHHGRSPKPLSRLLDVLTPGATPQRRTGHDPRRGLLDTQTALEHSAQDRAIVGKQRGSQYETRIRYAVALSLRASATTEERRIARDTARGTAHAIASAVGVYHGHNHYRRSRLRRPVTTLGGRRMGRGDLLSVPELAAVAHLPTDQSSPDLQRAGATAVSPPPGIVEPGPGAKPLGITDAGHPRPIGLRVADARHHVHVLGSTGSGKSTLLATMVLADADVGRANIVLDPKGDLVADILSRLPARLGHKVVLFDADAPQHTPCLNPLDGDKHRATDNIVSVFSRVFASAWGPRTDDLLRAGCLSLHGLDPAITRGQHATLAHLPELLTRPGFRERVVATITDPVLTGFWTWYDQLSDASRAQIVAPLMNKLRAVLLRPFVARALTGGASTVDLSDVLDHGGLLLARIPKGTLGEDTTRLVGSLLVANVWHATTHRARVPEARRADAAMVIDECHNFLNMPFPLEDMLAEARAYHLSLVLAHQHLDQLGNDLAQGVSTNARTKIYFSMSPSDAHQLARHTHPRLTEHDLSHLGAFHAAVRPVLHGEQTAPFTLSTQPLPPPVRGRATAIRKAAAIHAARPGSAATDQRRPYIDPRRHAA